MSPDSLKEAKRIRRRTTFALIRALGDDLKAEFSSQICAHLEDWEIYQNARSVGVYIAVGSEPDLGSLVWNGEKSISVPGIGDDSSLHFYSVNSNSDLMIGEFGIFEPDPDKCSLIDELTLDLILVPGVGFDLKNGARLGRGKGHYDRFLDRCRKGGNRTVVVGGCFSVQLQTLTAEKHDQPMDFVVSEAGIASIPC